MPTFKQRRAAIMRAVQREGAIKVPRPWATPDLVRDLTVVAKLKHAHTGDVTVFCTAQRFDEEMARRQAADAAQPA